MPDDPLTHHVEDQPEVRVGHHQARANTSGPTTKPHRGARRADPPSRDANWQASRWSEVRATIVFARRQSDKPFWPLGLCIAWVMRHDLVQAVKLFARRRLGLQYDRDEWATARTKLQNRLGEGRIQAFGLTPRGESASRFQRWNGSICGSRSAARTKRSAMKAVLLHITTRGLRPRRCANCGAPRVRRPHRSRKLRRRLESGRGANRLWKPALRPRPSSRYQTRGNRRRGQKLQQQSEQGIGWRPRKPVRRR